MSTTKLSSSSTGKDDSSGKSEGRNPVRPSASYSITIRMKIRNTPGMLGKVTSLIGEEGADIGAIDIAGFEKDSIIRDVTINVRDVDHGEKIVKALEGL